MKDWGEVRNSKTSKGGKYSGPPKETKAQNKSNKKSNIMTSILVAFL